MTEEQNGNGRRPMFVETADHLPSQGYTIHQRTWKIRNPFDRERYPVIYWLFWRLGNLVLGLTIVVGLFCVLRLVVF